MKKNDRVLSQLAKVLNPDPVQPGELTIKEIYTKNVDQAVDIDGYRYLGEEAIRYRMEKLVKEKLLTRRKAKRKDGQPCIAYKPVDGKTWDDVIEYLNK